jgi:hypothetical protein
MAAPFNYTINSANLEEELAEINENIWQYHLDDDEIDELIEELNGTEASALGRFFWDPSMGGEIVYKKGDLE